jgi:hypothetical protein
VQQFQECSKSKPAASLEAKQVQKHKEDVYYSV